MKARPLLHVRSLLLLLLLARMAPADAAAQETVRPTWVRPPLTIGSPADDRLRTAQLLGAAPADGYLIRSPSSVAPSLVADSAALMPEFQLFLPELKTVWNSHIPFTLNDGAMWAGRGATIQATAGFRAAFGRASLIFAPELIYHQNADFDFIPYSTQDRSRFAAPWHSYPESLDLPMRFGARPFTTFSLGQTTLAVDAGPVVVGVSTENQWWGPGVRNAIVMSNHAAGIPHLFLRTGAPVQTRIGAFEARWMAGGLTESPYFDRVGANDVRSISALAVAFRPAVEPDLTLGVTRAVYAPADDWQDVPLRLFDVFTDVGRPNARPKSDLEREPGPDQIFSLFGRWIFPEDGFEVYGEWARHERPVSLRDLLLAPHHSQGYTVGLQWARPLGPEGSALRLQSELTYLEQSSTFRQRRVVSFYKSRPVLQGYTQRGQVIGASIGPGASSQWAAADYLAPGWQLGLFAGRIRWENDEHYFARVQPLALGHDVSVFAGVRGGIRLPWVEVHAEYTGATRLNYLFQYTSTGFDDIRGMDLRNHTLQLTITPVRH